MKGHLELLLMLAALSPVLAGDAPPQPVQVRRVDLATNAIPVEAAGVLAHMAEVNLSFPAGGVVKAVLVRAGDRVRKGEMLARLDLDEIEARLAQARAAAEQARRDADRGRALYASRTIGAEEWENIQTAQLQAAAALQAAEFQRRYAVVEAPSDGQVLRRLAEPNQIVAAGQPILGFAADHEGWLIRIALAERDLMRIQVGDQASIAPAARPEERFTARVAHIAAGSDERTGTTEVELVPEAVPAGLRSGFVVHAVIQPAPVAPRARVPASALVEGQGDQASVFIVDAATGQAHRENVRIEAIHGEYAYLAQTLPAEAEVVIRGAESLREGAAAQIQPGHMP